MHLLRSELIRCVKSWNLGSSTKNDNFRAVFKVPVLMTPIFASDSNTWSGLIDYEWNLLFMADLSNSFIERWFCDLMTKEGNWFHYDCFYGMHSVLSFLNQSSEMINYSVLFVIIELFIMRYWVFDIREITVNPLERWKTNVCMTSNCFNSC